MDFQWNNIWLMLAGLLVLWIISKVLTSRSIRSSGDHFQKEIVTNEKFHQMEDGNFTDEDLKQLLPGQRVLAVMLVRKKYGLGLKEASAYVDHLQKGKLPL